MLDSRLAACFAAAADTLFPAVSGRAPGAEQLGVAHRLATELRGRLPDDRARGDLERLLRTMDSGLGAILLFGMPGAFTSMTPEARVEALRRMSRSPIGRARLGFKALKALAGMLYVNPPGDADRWPVWEAMGYPGPHLPPPGPSSGVAPATVEADATWECDVVVVGSGAGGGVAAGVLAAAGLDVVVLEKGPHREPADFTHRETEALADLYLDGALGSTADGGVSLIAGSALGGGTIVNYTTSFATPPEVRAEWDRVSGLRGVFTGADFEASSRAVRGRFGVNRDHNQPSNRDRLMEEGLETLGWHHAAMPRNVIGCDPDACGWCGLGCRLGAKQSTLGTWLRDAHASGARIVAGASVERVLVRRGRAKGVTATVDGHRLEVQARAVVLAAGALCTPALLQASGMGGGAVGERLRLHPVTVVWGRFSERVDPWTGILQARYSDEFCGLSTGDQGFRFETAPVHPTLVPLLFGWDGSDRLARDLLDLGHWSPIGILLQDEGSGRVTRRADGSAKWTYRFARADLSRFRKGVEAAARVLAAAGAEEVMSSTLASIRWRPGDGGSAAAFADEVGRFGLGPNRTVYLSFHQMGSAAMGSSPQRSVVDGDNESHRVKGLFVMDGSTFPTASGVNPMISISTIAHRAARALAARLA